MFVFCWDPIWDHRNLIKTKPAKRNLFIRVPSPSHTENYSNDLFYCLVHFKPSASHESLEFTVWTLQLDAESCRWLFLRARASQFPSKMLQTLKLSITNPKEHVKAVLHNDSDFLEALITGRSLTRSSSETDYFFKLNTSRSFPDGRMKLELQICRAADKKYAERLFDLTSSTIEQSLKLFR